jgi:hypothetical protein
MRSIDTPSDRKKTLKISLQAKWGPGLDLPKTINWWVYKNILWQPHCQDVSVSARIALHLPPQVERRQRLLTESVQRQ